MLKPSPGMSASTDFPPEDPPSDFSDSTDDDEDAPDEAYLTSRLSIPSSLPPHKRHQRLLAVSNQVEKSLAMMTQKKRAASECEAVFESEKARLKDLMISHEEIVAEYERRQVRQREGHQALKWHVSTLPNFQPSTHTGPPRSPKPPQN